MKAAFASPLRRRLTLGGLLLVCLLTGIGHGAGTIDEDSLRNLVDPEEPGCADGTLSARAEGDAQVGIVTAPLGAPVVFRLQCLSKRYRNVISPTDAAVEWEVTSGGGSANGETRTTVAAPYGMAQVNWQLGSAAGTQTLSASALGQRIVFVATAIEPLPGGTCTDNVASTGTNFGLFRTVAGRETWTLAGSPYRGDGVFVDAGGTLVVEPGVQVCLSGLTAANGGRVVARGSAVAPIRLSGRDPALPGLRMYFGTSTAGAAPPTSELAFVQGEGVTYLQAEGHALVIEDSTLRSAQGTQRDSNGCAWVWLIGSTAAAAPTRVQRTVFEGFGGASADCGAAGVTLDERVAPAAGPSVFAARVTGSPGVGVSVAAGTSGAKQWRFESCDITGNGGRGLVLAANVLPISGCRFTGNGGVGLSNGFPQSFTVVARGNWWGDPAGPAGPQGDGVSAGVDASQPLAAPPALGY